jgi:hypothetical protein
MSEETVLTEGLDTAPAEADTAPKTEDQGAATESDKPAEEKIEAELKEKAKVKEAAWYDDLPDDLKADPNVMKYSSKEAFAKAHVNAVKLLGADKIVKPKDDDDEEGWGRVYDALGRPEASDKYELEKPELPDGMEWDTDAEQRLRNVAYANGWNQRQFNALAEQEINQRIETYKQGLAAHEQYAKERSERIEKELGAQLPVYKTNAQAVMKEYGDADLVAYLNESKLGDDPRFIKAFGRIGKELLGDSRTKTPERDQATQGADLQSQLAAWDKKNLKRLEERTLPDSERARLLRERSDLYERFYGTERVT